MNIKPDDPLLTAYAIGELEPAEAAEVEAALAESPEAKAEAEAIRATAALLEKEFGQDTGLELSEEQRSQVFAAGAGAESKVIRPDAFSRTSHWLGISAVAACVVAVGAIGVKEFILGEKDIPENTPAPPVHLDAGGGGETEDEAEEARTATPGEDLKRKVGKDQWAAGKPGGAKLEADEVVDDAVAANKEKSSDPTPARAQSVPGAPAEPSDKLPKKEMGKLRGALADAAVGGGQESLAAGGAGAPAPDAVAVERPISPKPAPPVPPAATAPAVSAAPIPEPLPPGLAAADGAALPQAELSRARRKSAPEMKNLAGNRDAVLRSKLDNLEMAEDLAGRASAFDEAASKAREEVDADAFGVPADRRAPEKKRALEGGESYERLYDTPFFEAFSRPLSTFSIDVDTASYSNMRRFVGRRGQLPPKDSVRVEELINYFDYDYPQPDGDHPFSVSVEAASCPWEKGHRLVRIGLKGKDMHVGERPPSNLVFLIDSSGSMRDSTKLPLLKTSLAALARNLNEDDRIGIVTYSGGAGVAMEPVHGDQKEKIIDVIDSLKAGGSTNGAGGIELAYKLAAENYVEGGTNRVILATDGDFNVGTTNTDELVEMVKARAEKDKIFLTVLGFGEGNLKEARMEQIANKGDGNYYYIDSAKEGRRVLVDKLSSTLVTIAKDVKIQVDFNPGKVHSYRLIGYANRRMRAEDFRDDKKDAGEIGAGHAVTALYQIVPADAAAEGKAEVVAAESKYRKVVDAEAKAAALVDSDELLTVALRYKEPEGETATEFSVPLVDSNKGWEEASEDYRFAASVAGFGMLLRESEFRGMLNYDLALELAGEGVGDDENGLRAEFVDLLKKAKEIAGE